MSVEVLHLITQEGQPYSSVRTCCEHCGLGLRQKSGDIRWTDDREVWRNAHMRGLVCCSKYPLKMLQATLKPTQTVQVPIKEG